MSFVFDIAEIPDLSTFVYDVKILYQLKGHKVRTLNELCNNFLSHDETEAYHRCAEKLKSHVRSYCECGIAVHDYELTQIVPASVLSQFSQEKQRVVAKLFHCFHDEHVIRFYEQFFEKLKCLHAVSHNLGLKFNFVGTKTGRLSFKSNTFNPYVLPKERRGCIEARPGYKLYQYDLKSSQPRMAIFSTQDDNFKRRFRDTDDIYSIFPGDRETNKVGFLRWMFSSNYAADDRFAGIARPIKELRAHVFDDAVHQHVIHNRFGRPLYFSQNELEPHRVFQNFISSTEADALYEILCKMQEAMESTNSRILFPFYDAVVCEVAEEDEANLLPEKLKQLIETNYMDHIFFCRLPVEVKTGSNFGALHAA